MTASTVKWVLSYAIPEQAQVAWTLTTEMMREHQVHVPTCDLYVECISKQKMELSECDSQFHILDFQTLLWSE